LLEVILCLAILAGALPALGQLIRMGMSSARQAEDMTQATIAAEGLMAEVVCGARPPDAVTLTPLDTVTDDNGNPMFVYSIFVDSSEQVGMLNVEVVVQRDPSSPLDPLECRLVRWMIDPDYVASVADAAAAAEEEAASSSSSSSSSSSGTGSSGSGSSGSGSTGSGSTGSGSTTR
jgi:uncharacterized membrane protein YgcG